MTCLTLFHFQLESGTGGITGTGGTASSRRKDGRGTKRGRDEDDTNRRPDLKLNVPEILKVLLVDDWEAVTKNNQVRAIGTANCKYITIVQQLVTLPRNPTVAEILHDFQEFVLSQQNPEYVDNVKLGAASSDTFQAARPSGTASHRHQRFPSLFRQVIRRKPLVPFRKAPVCRDQETICYRAQRQGRDGERDEFGVRSRTPTPDDR